MQVKLIALCTEETRANILDNICPIVQQKLNVSAVDVVCTTVFSDLYAISNNLINFLVGDVVIVGDFDNNIDLNLVKSIINHRFTNIQPFETGVFAYGTQGGSCVVINTGKFNFYDYLTPEIICSIYKRPVPFVFLKVFGIDKVNILEKLQEIPNINNFDFSVSVNLLEGEIAIVNVNNVPSVECQLVNRAVYELFNNYYYADCDKPILQILDEILTVRNVKLCVADVLTQGVFEQYLKEGLPNYSQHVVEFDTLETLEDIAINLQVGTDFLATHKKDSVELCYEMAVSMVEHLDADVALVLSGGFKIPFIGVGDSQAIHVYKYNFDHSSSYITQIVCRQAVFKIIKKLREN